MKSILAKMNLEKSRTKWGVYSCPSLYIFENRKSGKDKKDTYFVKDRQNIFSFIFLGGRNVLFYFYIFIISTELKEIRNFGSMLPNELVKRREMKP